MTTMATRITTIFSFSSSLPPTFLERAPFQPPQPYPLSPRLLYASTRQPWMQPPLPLNAKRVLDAFGADDNSVAVRKLYSGTTASSYPAIIGTTPSFTVQSNGEYLYLFYPGSTDVSNFLLNGVEGVNGAFLHIGTRDLQNRYGYEETYNIYRSNAPNAFNGDYLIIN